MASDRRAALVTGSTSGIALSIAQKLGSIGYRIAVTGIEPETEIAEKRNLIASRNSDAVLSRT